MSRVADKLAKVSERIYRRLLSAYPAEFRQEYGTELMQFFRDECRHRGPAAVVVQSLKSCNDVLISAPGAHMDVLKQDLTFASRALRRSPNFAATAILALALGIGANSAIFSLVYGVILSPLPFAEPGRLVMVWEKNPRGIERNSVSPPNFADYRANAKSLAAMAAFYEEDANLTGAGEPEHLATAVVTRDFFDVLGVRPALGAGFRTGVPVPGALEVVLSQGLWERRFGRDPGILGRTLRIDDRPYTVTGVMPASFRFPSRPTAAWTTLAFDPAQFSRQAHFLSAVARLKPGAALAHARAELGTLAAGLGQAYPASNRGWGATVVPLKEQIAGAIRPALLRLLGAVGLVLLIACANVANLLLARSTRRQGEIAIRTALGAGTRRIIRQMLTESVLLSLLGGAAGLALAWSALRALRVLGPAAIPRLDEVGLDGWVVAFTFLLALLTGVAAGLVPARRASRPDLNEGLKEGLANTKSFAGHGLRGLLITCEVALCVLLVLGTGLLVRSFLRLQGLNPGFDPAQALTCRIDMPASRYRDAGRRTALLTEIATRVRALPGIDSAGLISNLPLTGGEGYNRFGFLIEGQSSPTGDSRRFYARWVTPGYLRAMGIPLLRGRDFSGADHASAPPVVIIDAGLARLYFGRGNPVGRRIRLSYSPGPAREIVGVAGEVRLVSLETEPAPQIYVPVLQEPRPVSMSLVVRGPAATAPMVRDELRRIDAQLPVYDLQPLEAHVAASMATRRFNTLLMSLLAGLALILAAVGVYAVIGYMTDERRRETSIRVALGASPAGIVWLFVRQAMRYAATGIAAGLAAALLLTRVLSGLLFGISRLDRWTFGAATLITAATAFLACLVPALRAARVDPVRALRLGPGR